ncbi:hypothetical protein D3C72_1856690 [compost metagenome]
MPQWTDSAQEITGGPLGSSRVGHFDFFNPGSMSQPLQIQRSYHRDNRHQQLPFFTGCQQCLEHLSRVETQFFRSFQAIGRSLRVMFVTVHAVFGPNLFQQIQCRGHETAPDGSADEKHCAGF